MPPKGKRASSVKGKHLPRKSARASHPPPRFIEEDVTTDDSNDDSVAEMDESPMGSILSNAAGSSKEPLVDNGFLMQQLMATNKRLDDLVKRLDTAPAHSSNPDMPSQANLPQSPVAQPAPAPQALLNGALSDFIGRSGNQMISLGESSNLLDNFLILGATTDQKLKQKIWRNEYIDLLTLISSQDKQLTVTVDSANNPVLAMTAVKPKPIANIFQWLRLFSTYSAIYLEAEKNRHLGPAMFTYMVNILDHQKNFSATGLELQVEIWINTTLS